MTGSRPQDFKFETKETTEQKPDGSITTTKEIKRSFGTEDILAGLGGLIALLLTLGIVFGKVPLNELSAGIVGLGGLGTAVIGIIKARNTDRGGGGMLWLLLGVALLVGIAIIAWYAWR